MSVFSAELRVDVLATLEEVESFCVEFRLWRVEACPDLDAFSSELLLREALTNSIVHGGTRKDDERIACRLRVKRGRLIIAIQDGGKGFDWRSAWNRRADFADTDGRGIEILRRYANAVRFNPKGNSVTMIKRF